MDIAASEFYDQDHYVLKTNGDWKSSEDMINWYDWIINNYPVVSIEDGLAENDWANWKIMTERMGSRIQLVGDDLFVTNEKRLEMGIKKGAGNTILIKPNQIGSLTETLRVIDLARQNGYGYIISHRSGDTDDTAIADIAVATGAGFIKSGAPCRAERVAKYNRLLEIKRELGSK
jgi:enolase